jgi:hypothetical protein
LQFIRAGWLSIARPWRARLALPTLQSLTQPIQPAPPKEPTMNTSPRLTLKSFAVFATAAVAILGAAVLATSAPQTEVVQLERVVIVGKRTPAEAPVVVAQLPRVVITGRSVAAMAPLQLAEASVLKAKML